MKVLITGSTANQTNPATHQRHTNFAGLVVEALSSAGVEVVWQRPDKSPTSLDEYDKVLIGLGSPLSLSSHHMYGALSLASELWNDPKLLFYVDAPDPNNVTRGLESVFERPDSLFKEFFTRRPGYNDVDRELLIDFCRRLLEEKWPTTIAPSFPWTYENQVSDFLPEVAEDSVELVNLDSFVFDKFDGRRGRSGESSRLKWVIEKRHNQKWLESLALSFPTEKLYSNHREDVHDENISKLQAALGFLHGPYRLDRTWWTPHVAMALSQGTAVFTNWRYSKKLGPEWAVLPGTFETFSPSEQDAVALGQYEAYMSSIPSKQNASRTMTTILGL